MSHLDGTTQLALAGRVWVSAPNCTTKGMVMLFEDKAGCVNLLLSAGAQPASQSSTSHMRGCVTWRSEPSDSSKLPAFSWTTTTRSLRKGRGYVVIKDSWLCDANACSRQALGSVAWKKESPSHTGPGQPCCAYQGAGSCSTPGAGGGQCFAASWHLRVAGNLMIVRLS